MVMIMMMKLFALLVSSIGTVLQLEALHLLIVGTTMAYSPHLDRQAIAGVWRLRGKSYFSPTVIRYPMKEFTTYPKKQDTSKEEEYLLVLKEDGSFQQCDDQQLQRISRQDAANNKNKKRTNDNSILSSSSSSKSITFMKGTWDYRDGKLILAADRADNQSKQVHDTMLVGTVVAKSQESLTDNSAGLALENDVKDHDKNTLTDKLSSIDTHLSVPKGAVKVGKFMYPKTHKMFFEQLMFKPLSMGSFELKQILGNLNAAIRKQEENNFVEKFRKSDFEGKKFLMTTFPIPERQRKGDLRWSIKYNKFVNDPIPQSKAEKKEMEEREANQTARIRVMELQLFPNNTFSTTAGLGDSTILRGKWWIIGDQRDQLWMQVFRFGFGRSVSGSTYSEGRMLSHDDAKSYWGRINHVDEDNNSQGAPKPAQGEGVRRQLQVKGSVIVGYGLEPQPVGRFIMREELEEDLIEDEEDDDDDYDDLEMLTKSESPDEPNGDGNLDWSTAFQ